MNIVNIDTSGSVSTPHGVLARKILDTEHAQVMHLTLLPGESLKKHITPVDVFFYVLEGSGTVEIGEEKCEVGMNTLIESPRDIPHCWHNQGSSPLKILVVKTPRPVSATKML